nr:hypothetical protein [Tanacetum cinerariifolium]
MIPPLRKVMEVGAPVVREVAGKDSRSIGGDGGRITVGEGVLYATRLEVSSVVADQMLLAPSNRRFPFTNEGRVVWHSGCMQGDGGSGRLDATEHGANALC